VGTLFSVPFASASTAEVQAWLKKEKIQVFTTFIENSKPYTETSFGNATALVLGTEAYGLTEAWRLPQYQNCEIPMRGQNDSLNISVAAAVLAFEVIRQRSL
jgi:TrmH family RNA methyltransferase